MMLIRLTTTYLPLARRTRQLSPLTFSIIPSAVPWTVCHDILRPTTIIGKLSMSLREDSNHRPNRDRQNKQGRLEHPFNLHAKLYQLSYGAIIAGDF